MIDKDILDEVLPVPELETLKEQTIGELKEEGFAITNFHSGGVFYTLLLIVLRVKVEFTELLRDVLNNMFLTHASGVWVDLKAADYGKKRKKAQKTQGLVTLSRTNDQGEAVKIPKGHVFKTEKDVNGEELRFFVLEAAVLQKGARSVDVLVEAEKEGSRYNVPEAQITRSLTFLNGIDGISNGEDWIVREGSDTEDDESLRTRGLRSWSELAARSIEDTFINTAEAVPGVLFAQADCDHPRGQGTVDVIVTGTAGEATEGLLKEVREAVDKIAGPYDNVIVKSSVTAPQDIEVTVTTADVAAEEEVENRVNAILADLLAVRKGRRFNELRRSDINFAIRNQFSIFFTVVGRIFVGMKKVVFRGRSVANVASASPVMLPVHGQDRDMPRLEGEDVESYRTRLSMKGVISEWSGTKTGILYALAALGYEESTIEPFSYQDPERWAEFIIFLKGSKQSGINNLTVIDAEVRKVKEGSSKPAYGAEAGNGIEIRSQVFTGFSRYPRCGEIVCGVWPRVVSIGHLLASDIQAGSAQGSGEVEFPKVGTIAASEKFYQPCAFVMYEGLASCIEAGSKADSGAKIYPMCSPALRCSGTTYMTEGGEADAENTHSGRH